MKNNKKFSRLKKAFGFCEHQKVETSKYIIGYVDILGVKEILKKGNHDFVNQLNELYNAIKEAINKVEKNTEKSNVHFSHLEIKIFSDNIVFAIKYNKKNWYHNFIYMVTFLSFFQKQTLIDESLLMRGGICIGELYIDDVFVCGKGLIEAYSLETDVSVYPRILIDRNIICQIGCKPGRKRIMEDFDEQFFVDYLIDMTPEDVEKIEKIIRKKTIDAREEPKILAKIGWLENYAENVISDIVASEEKIASGIKSIEEIDTHFEDEDKT